MVREQVPIAKVIMVARSLIQKEYEWTEAQVVGV
jgi:hypothetical protein